MRIWIWLACAACGGAGPSPITEAAGSPGSLAITSAAELVAPGIVSSPYAEIRLAASPDGAMVLWVRPIGPAGPADGTSGSRVAPGRGPMLATAVE